MTETTTTASISSRWFAVVLILVLVLPAAWIFYQNLRADPFQLVFRDDASPVTFLSRNGQDRYQNPGIVLHYQPAAVVVGHSLAANFQPTSIERELGWFDAYNLSMQGSTIYEHRRVLDYALARSEVEQVLWLFFPPNLGLPPKVYAKNMAFPEFLYDHSRLNDLRFFATFPSNFLPYLEDKQRKRELLDSLAGKGELPDPRDYSTNWQLTRENRFNAADEVSEEILGDLTDRPRDFEKRLRKGMGHLSAEAIADLPVAAESFFHANVEQNLRQVVASHPGVQFVFVPLPPLTWLHWQHVRVTDPDKYRQQLAYVRRFVEIMAEFPNVEVHLFGLTPVAADLRLYRDYGHYHQAVNELILSAIAQGRSRVTAERISDYLSRFDRRVLDHRQRKFRMPILPPDTGSLRAGQLDLDEGRALVSALDDGEPT